MYAQERYNRINLDYYADKELWIVWIGVFQYCIIRVVMTIIAVAAQAFDFYCEDSDSPAFAHVWVRYTFRDIV